MSHSISSIDPVSLAELLPAAEFRGADDIRLRSVCCDSRQCRAGDVFVALAGTQADGHDFIAEAISRGVIAVVATRALDLSVPVCVVPDAHEALGQICQAMAGHPSRNLRVLAVTGTNGKTTTTHLIESILQTAGLRTGLIGTIGCSDGFERTPSEMTTPAAPTLAKWLGRMVDNGCSHAVLEVSSHALSQNRLAGIELSAACLTNLQRDHLDYHGSLSDYHRAKSQVFRHLSQTGVAVINADDPLAVAHAPLVPGGVLHVGLGIANNVTATLIERCKSEQTFMLTAGDMSAVVRTAMIGDHHLRNCLIATAVGLLEGIDLPTIVRGLENVGHVPGRLQRIECGQPFGAFVDFAHTPDALAASLSTLREVTAGRLICVFGAGGNRDATKRPLMGRVVEAHADVAIVTTDNPRNEDPRTIASEIVAGCSAPDLFRYMPDREQAIRYALSLAGPDDCVVIAGRGHEEFQIIGDQRLPLDDADIVRRYLYNLEPRSRYGTLASVANS